MLNLFPAISRRPLKIRFVEQEPDEHIELFLRQHWVTNLGWIITAFLAALFPFFLPLLVGLFGPGFTADIPASLQLALLVLWYLIILAYALENYLFWYFNVYIVTNKHLIDIIFHSVLSRSITEVQLNDVQSARSHLKGMIRSLFNFGDVIIETAAKKQNIEFFSVPRPDFVTDLIGDLREHRGGAHVG